MTDTSQNNKRIAKNTLLLYVRMLFMMLVSLYTSRVILEKLGITDYGIYNVVGGIVSMLGFLTSSMSNAVQRFLSFEIGRGNTERINRIFNVALITHFFIAVIVLIVMEIGGVWYLNKFMNIPIDRLDAANWVLQCSILTTIFTIVQVPYNAIIIAKEQMGIYAYLSILEVILKLAIVYLLVIGHFDRLKLYSVLVMVVTIGILIVYIIYCIKKYDEVKYRFVKDVKTLKEMTNFAGWNMLGELAWVFTGQGVNIILNLFFGPAVNAARGLADQVNGAVSRFVSNFQTAVNPQIIKTYATNDLDDMKILLYRGIRFSYYLLFLLSMPLILNMDFILHVWLKNVPTYATGFCQLVLVCSLVSSISNLLAQVARAYGKISKYQICVSAFLLLNFPLSYLFLKLGASPLSTMLINIGIQAFLLLVRLYFTKKMINLSVIDFAKNVLLPIIEVSILSMILPLIVFHYMSKGLFELIVTSIVSVICSICCIMFIGIDQNERKNIIKLAINIIHKIYK